MTVDLLVRYFGVDYSLPLEDEAFWEMMDQGVSGGYGPLRSKGVAAHGEVSLGNNECGYWAFVPVIKKIWSVLFLFIRLLIMRLTLIQWKRHVR